jgi:hypothetical protein
MRVVSSLALWMLASACTDYGLNIIEYPEPAPPDSEPPFVDTQQEDTQPPVDTQSPPSCGDGPWPDGEAAVDEHCIWEPMTGTFRPVVEWWIAEFEDEFSDGAACHAPPVVGQVTDDNGDGVVDSDDVPDIAMTAYRLGEDYLGTLRLVSGDGSVVHWATRETELDGELWAPYGLSGTALGDVDGDGDVEIAVAVSDTDGDAYGCGVGLYDHTGMLLWVNDDVSIECGGHAPAFADLEGDGTVELIVGRGLYDPTTGDLIAEGEWGRGYDTDYGNSGYHSFAIDMDGDGTQEVVTGNTLYDETMGLICYTGYDDGYPAVADLDGDGLGELVTTGNGWVRLFEHDCWMIDQWQLFDGGFGGPATIADYDGDGEPEIGVASYGIYYVFEVDGTLLWSRYTQDHSSSSTGSSVYDFDGDGYAEVVYADEEDLWIYAGTDGTVRMQDSTHTSGTINEYPTIVDVDGDGEVEIVVVDSYGLFVIGDYDNSWVAGRQVWNQASYNIVNVNDDLSIPASPQPNWPGHNNFRSGDITRAFASAAPDPVPLLVDLCSLECEAGILQLTVQVGNAGLGAVEGPLVVSVYAGAEAIGDPLVTSTTIASIPSGEAGAALVLRLEVDGLELEALTVVVDDSGAIPECHEDNNTLTFTEGLCP